MTNYKESCSFSSFPLQPCRTLTTLLDLLTQLNTLCVGFILTVQLSQTRPWQDSQAYRLRLSFLWLFRDFFLQHVCCVSCLLWNLALEGISLTIERPEREGDYSSSQLLRLWLCRTVQKLSSCYVLFSVAMWVSISRVASRYGVCSELRDKDAKWWGGPVS
jgi:hypothetical protein